MTRHYLFRTMILLAVILVFIGMLLYFAIQWGLGVDLFLYKLFIGLIICFAMVLLTVSVLLSMAFKGQIKAKSMLSFLRGLLISIFPVLYLFKPLNKTLFKGIQRDFVALNNALITHMAQRYTSHEILILTPHCLQNSKCPIKVSTDVNECVSCGKCKVADLKALQGKYGIRVVIATGGTLARKFIVDKRPNLIIAVACERDLVSGIIDSKKVCTYGIFNERPNGPCVDTTLQMEVVVKVVMQFLKTV